MTAAEQCYRHAAEQGSPVGIFNVGVAHFNRKENAQALEYFHRAAALGDTDAQEACLNLDDLTLRGHEAYDLRKTDPVRAHEEFRQMAEQGSVYNMFHLAWTYDFGCGTAVNFEQAVHWYRRAFNEGVGYWKAEAAFYLGNIYYARKDYATAHEYLQYACDQCIAKAIYVMGRMYARGLGVDKDVEKARSLCEQAACLGNFYALGYLAMQDLTGRFGLRNFLHGLPRLLRAIRGLSSSLEKVGNRMIYVPKE
jgi:TPR repeat protein